MLYILGYYVICIPALRRSLCLRLKFCLWQTLVSPRHPVLNHFMNTEPLKLFSYLSITITEQGYDFLCRFDFASEEICRLEWLHFSPAFLGVKNMKLSPLSLSSNVPSYQMFLIIGLHHSTSWHFQEKNNIVAKLFAIWYVPSCSSLT